MAPKSEQAPPGGSSHAGHYNTAAFAAYVFPAKDGPNDAFKSRTNIRSGGHKGEPGAFHEAVLDFHCNKEISNPSRLKRNFDAHAQMAQTCPGGFRSLRLTRSSPDLGQQEPPETNNSMMGSTMGSTSRSGFFAAPRTPPKEEPEMDPLMKASFSMNTRFFPHVCANRGTLRLSGPAALQQGIDPGKDREHQCPFFEAPKHRFAEVKSLPGGKPATPTKSMKWRSDMAWSDESNHASFKVTHTLPRAMSLTTRTATWRGASFRG